MQLEAIYKNHDEYFDKALDEVLKYEGGYVNDPIDKGGETKYGISKRSYPHLDIENFTLEQAKEIYYKDFWIKNKCNTFCHYGLAEKIFSLSVNMGCKKAAQIVQRALAGFGKNINDDGIIGIITLKAIFKVDPAQLLAALKSEAAGYYRLIVANDNSQQKFLTGWLNRAYG